MSWGFYMIAGTPEVGGACDHQQKWMSLAPQGCLQRWSWSFIFLKEGRAENMLVLVHGIAGGSIWTWRVFCNTRWRNIVLLQGHVWDEKHCWENCTGEALIGQQWSFARFSQFLHFIQAWKPLKVKANCAFPQNYGVVRAVFLMSQGFCTFFFCLLLFLSFFMRVGFTGCWETGE